MGTFHRTRYHSNAVTYSTKRLQYQAPAFDSGPSLEDEVSELKFWKQQHIERYLELEKVHEVGRCRLTLSNPC